MKIVVLDGYTLNPGDISWVELERLGEVTVFDRTEYATDAVLKNIADAEVVFTNKTPINKDVLDKAPNLKYIGVLATGFNVVDVKAAKSKNITVTNIPDYSSKAVAQFTMALLLELCHNVGLHNASVKKGDWVKSDDFCYWNKPLIELAGKTLGLIGFGKIGKATAKLAKAFDLKVLVYTRTLKADSENNNLQFTTLDYLLENSDFISLHCPLTEETKELINAVTLTKMKKSAMLLNTSRGPLINEQDLADALNQNQIAAAAIDVVSEEPMKANNPLLTAKNCIITPHIAWAPKEARLRLMQIAVENLKAFLGKKPVNVVG